MTALQNSAYKELSRRGNTGQGPFKGGGKGQSELGEFSLKRLGKGCGRVGGAAVRLSRKHHIKVPELRGQELGKIICGGGKFS